MTRAQSLGRCSGTIFIAVTCIALASCSDSSSAPSSTTGATAAAADPDTSTLAGVVISPGPGGPIEFSASSPSSNRALSYADFLRDTGSRLKVNDELILVFTGATEVGTSFRVKLTLPGDNAGSSLNLHPDLFQVPASRVFSISLGDGSSFGLTPAQLGTALQFVVVSGSEPLLGLNQDRTRRARMLQLRVVSH